MKKISLFYGLIVVVGIVTFGLGITKIELTLVGVLVGIFLSEVCFKRYPHDYLRFSITIGVVLVTAIAGIFAIREILRFADVLVLFLATVLSMMPITIGIQVWRNHKPPVLTDSQGATE